MKTISPRIRKEALELAAKDCVGNYTLDHIEALKVLAEEGLVENTSERNGMSRFYRITKKGKQALKLESSNASNAVAGD